ncbi:MAG TPA: sulfatase-like hydrolase/transferase [Polyangiales bacterium]|nr:sulfatase-like hydrolase/transferase [Polyangiales bacterium]
MRGLGTLLASYALCGAGVGALCNAVDHGLSGSAVGAQAFGFAIGLGAGAGLLAGSKVGLAIGGVALLPKRARAIAWSCAALLLVVLCSRELGVVERLSGAYSRLAWLTLIALVLFAAMMGGLAAAATPALGGPQLNSSWLARRPAGIHRGLLGLLLLAACALLALDHGVLVGGYPFVHELLERCALAIATIALVHAASRLSLASMASTRVRVLLAASVLALGCSAWPLTTIGPARGALIAALRSAALVALALDDLRALGDVDADGFALWLGGGDCAPFDPEIHPAAQEITGNGIDDNCRLGDRIDDRATTPSVQWSAEPGITSIVLITIDALRADHLGSYGYPRATSPHIDAWFSDGMRFADAIAPGAYTTVTMPALMRGKHARALHWSVAMQSNLLRLVRDARHAQLAPGERWTSAQLIADDARHPSLAEQLRARGYETAAVVDDGGSSFLAPQLMAHGFARYVYVPSLSRKLNDPRGDELVAEHAVAALAALTAQASAQPFLLWLHFYGVHAPDTRHADAPVFGDDVVAGYDHEIAHVDQQLKRVFAALDELQGRVPLVALLSADHGERMYRTGRAHGSNLAEDEVHVPLLVRGHGIARGVASETVSLLDIAPTVLALCGARQIDGLDGVDLFATRSRRERSSVLSDVWRYDARGRLEFDRVAAVSRELRLVFDVGANAQRVYRRAGGAALLTPAPALERAVFEYLEETGPQPRELLH